MTSHQHSAGSRDLAAPPLVPTVAALYVAPNGSYIDVPGVDPWPEARDARLYRGPHPVVAHPPCQRWGKFWAGQPLFIKQTGIRKVKGDDGGCFAAALASVREHGGVIEHPCDSHAWAHFGLAKPPRAGGWIKADDLGGWSCCVEQGRYGHYARKPTWLYVFGCERPELDWGISEPRLDPAIVERMGLKRAQRLGEVGGRGGGKDSAPRIGTPIPFRDLLLSIARTAVPAYADAASQIEILRVRVRELHRRAQKAEGALARGGRKAWLDLALRYRDRALTAERRSAALSSKDGTGGAA